jgi:hypothetical protein
MGQSRTMSPGLRTSMMPSHAFHQQPHAPRNNRTRPPCASLNWRQPQGGTAMPVLVLQQKEAAFPTCWGCKKGCHRA